MKNVNQRLKQLTETYLCQAKVADEYHKELLPLADEIIDAETVKKNSKFFTALSDEGLRKEKTVD